MVTLARAFGSQGKLQLFLWVAGVTSLATLLGLLAVAVKGDPVPSVDRTIMATVSGWDLPGLTGFAKAISVLTSNYPIAAIAFSGIVFLWLLGMTRTAVAFAVVGGVAGILFLVGDHFLGDYVGRSRPFSTTPETSFPSGHTFGTTALFGFTAYLAIQLGLKGKLRIGVLSASAFMIVAVGLARVHERAHWPSDVAAGYLIGGIGLLGLIALFLFVQRLSWFSPIKRMEDALVESCESCRLEHSIASTVVLNPDEGTATKTYQPPPVVRLIYWLSFQARFPYESNPNALRAATYRRKIASLLTTHRFGKDLVAHVTAENCNHGNCTFVTEFIPGDKVENDDEAKEFLGQVAETFGNAGLGVWQINPRNPHAHTNLIKNKDGEFIVIDLESAVVTPFPAHGQWRAAFKAGRLPIFDDIDFDQLRRYIAEQETGLQESLGEQGLADLREAVHDGEEALLAWQRSEPRIWGMIIRSAYRLLNWKAAFQHVLYALDGADRASERLLNRGIARWEAANGLSAIEADELRAKLSERQAQTAIHHMGAHLVLSLAIALPIPGARSLARFLWTFAFLVKAQAGRLLRREGARDATSVHTPLVMVLALLPAVGGIAYLAARPLRSRLLIRIAFDEVALELPFSLYRRLRLASWLAPKGPIRVGEFS